MLYPESPKVISNQLHSLFTTAFEFRKFDYFLVINKITGTFSRVARFCAHKLCLVNYFIIYIC